MSKNLSYKKLSAVDLFCGIGGLSYGLKQAGIEVSAGIDVDSTCEFAYEKNNAKFINQSITSISTKSLKSLFKPNGIKVLVGCAPCQTFSKHTLKVKNRQDSEKWRLLDCFAEKIEGVLPEIVSMENVPQLLKYDVYTDFIKVLEDNSYHVSAEVVFCPDYGIPQNRSRLVLLASRLGEIKLISPTHKPSTFRTVKDTIGKLEPIKSGKSSNKDPLHVCSELAEINLKRIKQSKPGGSWEDWDPELVVNCHRKATGKTYSSVYGRMEWGKPSPTITTQFYAYGTGRFGHPVQNRGLSLREGALLQTFPKKYQFLQNGDPITIKTIGRHIGNAVPVRLGKVIGKSIVNHLGQYGQ